MRPYRKSGAVFWCDMYAHSAKFVRMFDPWGVRVAPTALEAALQDLLDVHLIAPVRKKPSFDRALLSVGLPPSQLTQESGQLLMHKRKCLSGLAATMLLNLNTHRAIVYAGLHGDKDTFRLGFAAVGCAYLYVDSPPDLGGQLDETTGVFHDTCFIQRDVPGGLTGAAAGVPRPLFLHYCGRHREDDEDPRVELGHLEVVGPLDPRHRPRTERDHDPHQQRRDERERG